MEFVTTDQISWPTITCTDFLNRQDHTTAKGLGSRTLAPLCDLDDSPTTMLTSF